MTVIIDGHSHGYEMQSLVMMFFPGENVTVETDISKALGDYVLTSLKYDEKNAVISVEISVGGVNGSGLELVEKETGDINAQIERLLAVLCYRLLSKATGISPPWGILTGVRPVKLFGLAIESGMNRDDIYRYFKEKHLISEEKIKLALQVAEVERAVINKSAGNSFSLYVSIPFCPDRCSYCSFFSHSVEKSRVLIESYLPLLNRELEHTARIAWQLRLKLKTVYIGGGTPTTLSSSQLSLLLETISRNFELANVIEYTVEAGRPDTISEDKLRALRAGGVSRISVNPQTLSGDVLAAIGRRHTTDDIIRAYNMAREMLFENINMDIIAGLPSDTPENYENTVDGIIKLLPESVTVHTLSLKRSSLLREEKALLKPKSALSNMLSLSYGRLMESGYAPYYLYRQKHMIENLENTGFSKPGYEGCYNIYIMNETHTVLAVGAGAVTKLKENGGTRIERIFNYKIPHDYITGFEEMLSRKTKVIEFYEGNHTGQPL